MLSIYKLNKNNYIYFQHGGFDKIEVQEEIKDDKKKMSWSGYSGTLYYHPAYGILHQITHYEVDGGPTYHQENGKEVHRGIFIWKSNPKMSDTLKEKIKLDEKFASDLQKIGTYSGSKQFINPEKKSFPELENKSLDYGIKYMKDNYPYLSVIPIKSTDLVIDDFRTYRVWLRYGTDNKISIIPTIG